MKKVLCLIIPTAASFCIMMLPVQSFGQINIPSTSFTYSQDFNTLPTSDTGAALTWSNNDTVAGWYQDYQGATRNEYSYQVVPNGLGGVTSGGSSTSSGPRFFNIGHANSTDRAVGMKRLFSTSGAISVMFQNNSGSTLTDFALGYTGEQWRRRGSAITPLHLEYQVVGSIDGLDIVSDPSNWTRAGGLQFDSPQSGSNLDLDGEFSENRTVIDPVTFSANVGVGDFLVIRWYQDRIDSNGNPTNVYHSLAIDDVSFAVVPEPAATVAWLGLLALGLAVVRLKRSRM